MWHLTTWWRAGRRVVTRLPGERLQFPSVREFLRPTESPSGAWPRLLLIAVVGGSLVVLSARAVRWQAGGAGGAATPSVKAEARGDLAPVSARPAPFAVRVLEEVRLRPSIDLLPAALTGNDGSPHDGQEAGRIGTEPKSEPNSDGRPDEEFVGVWGSDEKACSPQLAREGRLLAIITGEGAWAGETTCAFQATRRAGRFWTVSALCSDGRGQWKTKVKLSVSHGRLTWTSQRGSRTYVRCGYGPVPVDRRALQDRLIEASRA